MDRSPSIRSRHRVVLSGCLALSVMTGCFSPSSPTSVEGRRSQGGGTFRTGSAPAPTPTSISHVLPSAKNAASQVVEGEGEFMIDGKPVDPSIFIIGRVLAPPGILSNNGGSVIGQNTANVIGQNTANIVSNNGGSVIGQNTANAIGQNTANVIGQNTANVIGQNTANIVSNNGGSFKLGQRPLAYAAITLKDAAGIQRKDFSGNEISAKADAFGRFAIPRSAVPANSILNAVSPEIKGELAAFISRESAGAGSLEVDMVSTVTSTYILEKFVNGRQEVFDRLTAEIENEAKVDVLSALEKLVERDEKTLPTLDKGSIVSSVESLIAETREVEDVFERIEDLLILVGIVNRGEGNSATLARMGKISGILKVQDTIYLHSQSDREVRSIDKNGIIRTVIAMDEWPYPEMEALKAVRSFNSGLAMRDGWLYVCDTQSHRIVRTDGTSVQVFAGSGQIGDAVDGSKAAESPLNTPCGISFGNDGSLYFSDSGNSKIRRIRSDGIIESVYKFSDNRDTPIDLTVASDGSIHYVGGDTYTWIKNSVKRIVIGQNKIDTYGEVSNAECIEIAGGRTFVARNDAPDPYTRGDTGESYIYEIVNGKREIILPNINTRPGWINGVRDIHYSGGSLFFQTSNEVFVKLDLDSRELVTIGGFDPNTAAHTFSSGTSLLCSNTGTAVIADGESCRILTKEEGKPLKVLAGTGRKRFTRAAQVASESPMGTIGDMSWFNDSTLMFPIDSMSRAHGLLTGYGPPRLQLLSLDGKLDTIAGKSYAEDGQIPLGAALEVNLSKFISALRIADGRILLLNNNGRIDEVTQDLKIRTCEDWAIETNLLQAKLIGDQILYVTGDSYHVNLTKGRSTSTLSSLSEVNLTTGGSATFLSCAIADGEKHLFLATENQVVQKHLPSGRIRVLAGVGGLIFNEPNGDNALSSISDLAFSPDGDLLILEHEFLKKVPVSKIPFE